MNVDRHNFRVQVLTQILPSEWPCDMVSSEHHLYLVFPAVLPLDQRKKSPHLDSTPSSTVNLPTVYGICFANGAYHPKDRSSPLRITGIPESWIAFPIAFVPLCAIHRRIFQICSLKQDHDVRIHTSSYAWVLPRDVHKGMSPPYHILAQKPKESKESKIWPPGNKQNGKFFQVGQRIF